MYARPEGSQRLALNVGKVMLNVELFLKKPAIGSMSRLGAHGIARKPPGPLSTPSGLMDRPPSVRC